MRNLQTLKYAVCICTSCGDFYFLKCSLKDYLTIIMTFPDVRAHLRISILQLTEKPSRDNGENEIKSKKKVVILLVDVFCRLQQSTKKKNRTFWMQLSSSVVSPQQCGPVQWRWTESMRPQRPGRWAFPHCSLIDTVCHRQWTQLSVQLTCFFPTPLPLQSYARGTFLTTFYIKTLFFICLTTN